MLKLRRVGVNVLADLEAGLLRTEEEMGTMQLAVKRMFLWEASKLRRLPLLPAVLAAVCLTLALALSATPARAEVKTGTIGKGCSYTLDDSGKLTIYPTDGVSGEMAPVHPAWYDALSNEDVRSVVIEKGVSAPEISSELFARLEAVESLDLSNLDTSRVTYMGGMFWGCSSLSSLDLSGWDTSRVTGMWGMFRGCSSLSSLDLSGWDTSRVTDMAWMFQGCSSLASLDLSGWDTSRVTGMTAMFSGCPSLSSLDLSGWDTSRVGDMVGMFEGCPSLSSLDLSGWDTSQVLRMWDMFAGCSSLSSLDLSGWDTSRVADMGCMF